MKRANLVGLICAVAVGTGMLIGGVTPVLAVLAGLVWGVFVSTHYRQRHVQRPASPPVPKYKTKDGF